MPKGASSPHREKVELIQALLANRFDPWAVDHALALAVAWDAI
ncbi:MAG: hypothetical protein ACJ796_14560 [Gemmatimonadaceae bacterium]